MFGLHKDEYEAINEARDREANARRQSGQKSDLEIAGFALGRFVARLRKIWQQHRSRGRNPG